MHTAVEMKSTTWLAKAGALVALVILETAVFALMPLSYLPGMTDPMITFLKALTAALGLACLALWRSRRGGTILPALYALFTGGAALLASTYYATPLVRWLGISASGAQEAALLKLSESLVRLVVILALMAIARVPLKSIFLGRGQNLRLGLLIGVLGFLTLAAIAFVPLALQPGMVEKLAALAPWILIFVLSNGFNEELLFRGIFLNPFQALVGKWSAVIALGLVFTLLHAPANYVGGEILIFLAGLLPLALAWGWLMQKSGSLWGSALFHAGADCIIVLGVFATM